MLNIYNFVFNFIPLLSINDPNVKNILPPINNIYKTTLNIPLLGKQNIEYIRTELLVSKVTFSGKLNTHGYIYFDKNNVYNYKLDNNLKNIITKYKCTIINPYYDNKLDEINFKIRINIIRYNKNLILKNINLLC